MRIKTLNRGMKRSARNLILCTAFALISSPLTTISEDATWKPLFNGTNLDGWVNINGAQDTWSVKDRSIHCTGKPICALRTVDQYENFVLELEWRHLKPGGNAGVFIWSGAEPAIGQPFLRAIEVQVLDHAYGKSDWFTTHGDVFPIHGSKMKPFLPARGMRSFPSSEHSNGSPEWNHYRIHCLNGVLKLSVNGHEVSGGSDCNWRKGFIALESEGSPVEFKNIRVKELPSSDSLSSSGSAPPAKNFFNLYNGKNLSGWSDKAAKFLTSRDWRMVSLGADSEDEELPILWSDAQVSNNFEAFFDIKLPKDSDLRTHNFVSICINNDSDPILSIGNGPGSIRLGSSIIPSNRWTRVNIIVVDGEVTITNDSGYEITITNGLRDEQIKKEPSNREGDENPNNYNFGIVPPELPNIEFANFFIKSLD